MLKLEVCVGSACHVKGSYNIISKLQELVADNNLEDQVGIGAAFCFGHCAKAVSVHFAGEDAVYSVSSDPTHVTEFFQTEVRKRL